MNKFLAVLALPIGLFITATNTEPFNDAGVYMLQSGVLMPRNITYAASRMFEMVFIEFGSPIASLVAQYNRALTCWSPDCVVSGRLFDLLEYQRQVLFMGHTVKKSDFCPFTEILNPPMVDIPYDYYNTTQQMDPISGAHGTYFMHSKVQFVTKEFYEECIGLPTANENLGRIGESPFVIVDFSMTFNPRTQKFVLNVWEVNHFGFRIPGHWIMRIRGTFAGRSNHTYPADYIAYDIPVPIYENTMDLRRDTTHLPTRVYPCLYETDAPFEKFADPAVDTWECNSAIDKFAEFCPDPATSMLYSMTYNDRPSWYVVSSTTTEQRFPQTPAMQVSKIKNQAPIDITVGMPEVSLNEFNRIKANYYSNH
jgi:hypothetical protein